MMMMMTIDYWWLMIDDWWDHQKKSLQMVLSNIVFKTCCMLLFRFPIITIKSYPSFAAWEIFRPSFFLLNLSPQIDAQKSTNNFFSKLHLGAWGLCRLIFFWCKSVRSWRVSVCIKIILVSKLLVWELWEIWPRPKTTAWFLGCHCTDVFKWQQSAVFLQSQTCAVFLMISWG